MGTCTGLPVVPTSLPEIPEVNIQETDTQELEHEDLVEMERRALPLYKKYFDRNSDSYVWARFLTESLDIRNCHSQSLSSATTVALSGWFDEVTGSERNRRVKRKERRKPDNPPFITFCCSGSGCSQQSPVAPTNVSTCTTLQIQTGRPEDTPVEAGSRYQTGVVPHSGGVIAGVNVNPKLRAPLKILALENDISTLANHHQGSSSKNQVLTKMITEKIKSLGQKVNQRNFPGNLEEVTPADLGIHVQDNSIKSKMLNQPAAVSQPTTTPTPTPTAMLNTRRSRTPSITSLTFYESVDRCLNLSPSKISLCSNLEFVGDLEEVVPETLVIEQAVIEEFNA